jgi:hypothetical protein
LPEYAAVKNTPDQMKGFCTQLGNDKNAWEQKCNSMSPDVCASTDCCALLGGSKCVAANVNGPIMSSNYSDHAIQNRDFYYFQGKCYGNCYQNGASSMYTDTASRNPVKDAVKDAASLASTVVGPPSKTTYKVGDELNAIYMLTPGAVEDAKKYSAKITKDLDTMWEIEWQAGPLEGEKDKIQKDTLQKVAPLKPAPLKPAPLKPAPHDRKK